MVNFTMYVFYHNKKCEKKSEKNNVLRKGTILQMLDPREMYKYIMVYWNFHQ